jgi:hypothetical protein
LTKRQLEWSIFIVMNIFRKTRHATALSSLCITAISTILASHSFGQMTWVFPPQDGITRIKVLIGEPISIQLKTTGDADFFEKTTPYDLP